MPTFTQTGGTAGSVYFNNGTPEYTSLVAQVSMASNAGLNTSNGLATVHCGGVLSNFTVTLNQVLNFVAESVTFTVMVNGSASALTCTASGADLAQGCSDTTHSVVLNASDTVNVRGVADQCSPSATWTSQVVSPPIS